MQQTGAGRDPLERIEAGYREHPFIGEIGVLRTRDGPVAVIVPDLDGLRQGSESRVEEAIRQAVMLRNHQLPPERQVTDHVVSPVSLPRTADGILDRPALERRLKRLRGGQAPEGHRSGPVSPGEMSPEDRRLLEANPALDRLWRWLEDRFADQPLAPDARLQVDLDVDSLTWVELLQDLEEDLDIHLTEQQIAGIVTVRDLLGTVRDAPSPPAARRRTAPLEDPESVLTADQRRWLEPPSRFLKTVARFMFVTNRAVMRTVFGLTVHGRERLPDEEPFVLVPNHCSYLDPLAIFATIPFPIQMRTHWIAWRKIVRLNVLTHLAHRAGMALPVDSIEAPISSLAFGAAGLQRGRNLVWFPEGRRSPNGRLQPFQPGLGLLLEHHEVPVVPVRVEGTFEAWPAGQRFPRPRPISVHVGHPVHPRELLETATGGDAPTRILEGLRERLRNLGRPGS